MLLRYRKNGFTLIEILVSVGIIALIIGLSIAGYTQFNANQRLKQAALTFKNNLRMAQTKAISAQKPSNFSDCTELVGYRVALVNSNTYSINSVCLDTLGFEKASTSPVSFPLPSGIEFQGSFSVTFLPLTQGVSGATTVNFNLSGTTKRYQILIDASGDITESGLIE